MKAPALLCAAIALLPAAAIASSWPSPIRSRAEIPFSLSERGASGNVRLEIFDASGRRVATLLRERLTPGEHSVSWDGRSDGGAASPNGVYFARLTTGEGPASRTLVLMR